VLGPLPPSVPVFSAPPCSALDLLASAALASAPSQSGEVVQSKVTAAPTGGSTTLYNPIALVPAKVAKKILELEFVEMAEISAEAESTVAGRPSTSSRPPVTELSQWLEKYSLMAAILVTRFQDKGPEFFAYQASIIRAERNYEGKQWVVYDRQFRREALARKDLNWSLPNVRLYNEAFTGRARSIPRCSYCLADDHAAATCPINPANTIRQARDLYDFGSQLVPQSQDVCRNFNEGRCKRLSCRYQHLCLSCHEGHPWMSCPRRRSQNRGGAFRPPSRRFGSRY